MLAVSGALSATVDLLDHAVQALSANTRGLQDAG
jgi:hypothetical protein